jgi:Tubulin-tyrosine ligase family
MDDNRVV